MFGLLLLLLASVIAVQAIPIDNGVIGEPTVVCQTDRIEISGVTQAPFLGRVFAKGMSKKKECVHDFANGTDSAFAMQFHLAECGMLRERTLAPGPGLMEAITVVVSFHYLFVTKVDRAYSIQCFYSQQRFASVSQSVEISMIPTTSLDIYQGATSDCTYEVKLGSLDGDPAQFAQVGDKLYHIWKCQGPPDLKILVKSCSVYNNEDERFLIIDDRGCAIDPVIINDLTYADEGNMAFVESHAFKFADTSLLGFSCAIQLCSEQSGDKCDDLNPPACSLAEYEASILSQLKQRRIADAPLPQNGARRLWLRDEIDVSAPTLAILDPSFSAKPNRRVVHDKELERLRNRIQQPDDNFSGFAFGNERTYVPKIADKPTSPQTQVCLSVFTFNTLAVCAFGLILLMAVVSLVLFAKLLKSKKDWWSV